MVATNLNRIQRARLMQVWRSAGWPCRDAVEIELLSARLLQLKVGTDGHETVALTETGIDALAHALTRHKRATSAHDMLALRFAQHLMTTGRIVWRELSLRARVDDANGTVPHAWRMARPDLFSIRNTSVEAYLQPMVHEIKASRADLLSDLRHTAKHQAYRWLCSECYYVFQATVATAEDIPEPFGVWVWQQEDEVGTVGQFELLRPAQHAPCRMPFAVWMALAKSTPVVSEAEPAQGLLRGDSDGHGAADAPQR